MQLFMNKELEKFAVLGDKNVPYEAHWALHERGFKKAGSFYGLWDGLDPDWIKIEKREDVETFKRRFPMTLEIRVVYLERELRQLQNEKLKKDQ
ncbi:MAG: hypothetical protein B5M52_05170 [Helicobacteraceae bacterium 4484_230]|nr:MAG: hypothetical protein B5M52_05170 [Helicobacteraceae bacterium 4484_230]